VFENPGEGEFFDLAVNGKLPLWVSLKEMSLENGACKIAHAISFDLM
jgi:hypothetical protein